MTPLPARRVCTESELVTLRGMGHAHDLQNADAILAAKGDIEQAQERLEQELVAAGASVPIYDRATNASKTNEMEVRSGWLQDLNVQLNKDGTTWAGEFRYMGGMDVVYDKDVRAGSKTRMPTSSKFQQKSSGGVQKQKQMLSSQE